MNCCSLCKMCNKPEAYSVLASERVGKIMMHSLDELMIAVVDPALVLDICWDAASLPGRPFRVWWIRQFPLQLGIVSWGATDLVHDRPFEHAVCTCVHMTFLWEDIPECRPFTP